MRISEELKQEFERIIKDRMVSLVLFAVRPSSNAADTMDLIEKEGSVISSTAEMYFSA